MLFGLFNPKDKKEVILNNFKNISQYHGIKIETIDETGILYISFGNSTFKVNLDNATKAYEVYGHKVSYVMDILRGLLSYSTQFPSEWNAAKNNVFISLIPNSHEFSDFIPFDINTKHANNLVREKVTDEFSKAYVYVYNKPYTDTLDFWDKGHLWTSTNGEIHSWINNEDLKKWNITGAELDEQANRNADRYLETNAGSGYDLLGYRKDENRKLGLFEIEYGTNLRPALLFSSSMKERVKNNFSYPFYAAIPSRGYCLFFSEDDFSFFSNRIGKEIVSQYENSPYPITTEILKFSEKGVEAVGKFA